MPVITPPKNSKTVEGYLLLKPMGSGEMKTVYEGVKILEVDKEGKIHTDGEKVDLCAVVGLAFLDLNKHIPI